MVNTRSTKTSIQPAAGLKPALQEKSCDRRRTQKTLSSVKQHPARERNDLLPQLDVKYVPPDSLLPANRRLRRAAAAQIARVERSLKQFGICSPILIGRDDRIVHGHLVWEAARSLNLETVPVIRIEHLNETERRALAVALNRIAETGEWDVEALRVEIAELIELDEDVIVATGFELAEVDTLLLEDEPHGSEGEALPLFPQSAVSQPGDIWVMGDHPLAHGDSRGPEVYSRLITDGENIRFVLTDVSFNVPVRGHCTGQTHHREFAMAHGELSRDEFDAFNKDWMRLALATLVDGDLLPTFIDWRSVELILSAGRELGLELLNIVVWAKSNGGQGELVALAARNVADPQEGHRFSYK